MSKSPVLSLTSRADACTMTRPIDEWSGMSRRIMFASVVVLCSLAACGDPDQMTTGSDGSGHLAAGGAIGTSTGTTLLTPSSQAASSQAVVTTQPSPAEVAANASHFIANEGRSAFGSRFVTFLTPGSSAVVLVVHPLEPGDDALAQRALVRAMAKGVPAGVTVSVCEQDATAASLEQKTSTTQADRGGCAATSNS
ncbi:MAG: hypothetical protein JWM34_1099 [Ilumatobacteraceae bacterium]|nr:hypothetical protein [Ilumatobacteraceae bacterium]